MFAHAPRQPAITSHHITSHHHHHHHHHHESTPSLPHYDLAPPLWISVNNFSGYDDLAPPPPVELLGIIMAAM
jgi:hypothetical protein